MAFTLTGDEWFNDPRLCDAGPAGRDFFFRALMFCNIRRSDGRIRDEDLAAIAPGQRYPNKVARQLADLGLFQRVPGGYRIPPEIYRCFNRLAADLPPARRGLRPPPPPDRRPKGSSPSPGRLPADSRDARCHAKTTTADSYAVEEASSRAAPAENPHPVIDREQQLQDARARAESEEAERKTRLAALREKFDSDIERLAKANGRRGAAVSIDVLLKEQLGQLKEDSA